MGEKEKEKGKEEKGKEEKEKKGPKVVTVIIKVDLGCLCCAKKIKRTLCKLQKRFQINSLTFDWKETVTVSGPFDPNAFIKKLCCMAYKVIKDVYIKPDPPPKPPPTPPPPTPPPPTIPCPPPCPPPCLPLCPPPCLPHCPPLCPPTKPFPTPIWPGTCNEPNHDCGSCNTPRPPPCLPPCPPPWEPPTKPTPWPCPTSIWPGGWNEPNRDCCSSNTPQPPPIYNTGYPCYQIVCESEPSPVCSIM